jgi:hypothetical protein
VISRDQIIAKLRSLDYRYSDRTKRVEIYRKRGSATYVNVPLRDQMELTLVRIILGQAGLTPSQVNDFIAGAVK